MFGLGIPVPQQQERGRYKIRVLVTDGKNFGRAFTALRVEPVGTDGLALSDVTLDSILRDASLIIRDASSVAPAPLVPTPLVSKIRMSAPVGSAPPLPEYVQFLPFPYAQLREGNPLSVYFEIYESAPDKADTVVSYRMKITNLKTGATVMNTDPISTADFVVPGDSVLPMDVPFLTNDDIGKNY